MNYRLRREGEELGVFSFEELRHRRLAGELSGMEYVQGEGRSEWQPLDLFLQQGHRVMPPPLPPAIARRGRNQTLIWILVALGSVGFISYTCFVGFRAARVWESAQAKSRNSVRSAIQPSRPDALAAATKPVHWTTNTLTMLEVNQQAGEFRKRQWLEGYQQRGQRDQPGDAKAVQMIEAWIASNYGGNVATNPPAPYKLSDELVKTPGCDDPLVLTVAAANSVELFEKGRRLERAVMGFDHSPHRAYPKLYATILLASERRHNEARLASLDALALQRLKEAFADGSFIPGDQAEIAEIFIHGWGRSFFHRNPAVIYPIAQQAGKDFHWLALVLEGECHDIEAWAARGGGYADTVTPQGLQGFNSHLAEARKCFTEASELRPELPLAASRMIYVSLGDADIEEMRVWFDRAVGAQLDYSHAWNDLRWGLRPRWYGDEASMLALGVTAVNTRRFDTDVPRMLYDSISDVESEMELPPGQHIYGRADVWPQVQKMYEGYIAEPSQSYYRAGWRGTYTAMAYFAGKYNVARTQLEALNWEPQSVSFTGWDVECSLLPAEVAARTGTAGEKVARAELRRAAKDVTGSLALYTELSRATNVDTRSREFIRCRMASLELEQRLQKGEWIDFLPKDENDPNWVFSFGKARVLPDGALEVESDPNGHMLYSRVRVGTEFEVKGEFEVVRSSTKAFQAGIVMGLPEFSTANWNAFRMKRNGDEGQVASFSHGWGHSEVSRPVTLNDERNSFDFSFHNGKATASLNGTEVIKNAAPTRSIRVAKNDFMLGLGAYNDMNDTVIRYRNVQVRRLVGSKTRPAKAK